ncbi:hypothetical protein J6590_062930 [Homalodisca vitripennis]|nr:hypothetical protein J6590_062930 [Homalodisca vitripennis]
MKSCIHLSPVTQQEFQSTWKVKMHLPVQKRCGEHLEATAGISERLECDNAAPSAETLWGSSRFVCGNFSSPRTLQRSSPRRDVIGITSIRLREFQIASNLTTQLPAQRRYRDYLDSSAGISDRLEPYNAAPRAETLWASLRCDCRQYH